MSALLGTVGLHARPHARIDSHTRFADDPEAQRFVEEHPGGATLEEVGAMFGITRERARQIEAKALAKFPHRLALVGNITVDELRAWLASRGGP